MGSLYNDVTEELLYRLQDQVQVVDRKVSRLLTLAGEDPDEAGRLPADVPDEVPAEDGGADRVDGEARAA